MSEKQKKGRRVDERISAGAYRVPKVSASKLGLHNQPMFCQGSRSGKGELWDFSRASQPAASASATKVTILSLIVVHD